MYVIESKNLILKEANSTIKSLILINPRKERSIYIHFNERVENITEMLDDLNISYIKNIIISMISSNLHQPLLEPFV